MKKKTKIKLIAITAVLLILTAVTLAAMTPAIEPQAYLPAVFTAERQPWGTPQPCVIYPDGSEACP